MRPADRTKSNGIVFFNIINRGNKGGLTTFNVGIPGGVANTPNINSLTEAGDGFVQQQGYTMVWFGWQPDVVADNNRMLMKVPVARNTDGSAITGIVRNELTVARATPTVSRRAAGLRPAARRIRRSRPITRWRSQTVLCRR